ncbi:GlsB/YeaQ/YmgE family stress response membrane protein [Xinfangfangia sp. D13-10-4-6]|uniref:GlsB/YeaQ/YmgE family stress response membrane protein n=1 Tax=Pseudogemmobacter hezensis TaxID=2737662 RepID=UPI0015535E30|nr:GlsB/YeaQ/YmgE family stress response membrane protein [Pseudogemmobacter hezensis]NPD14548.1 GlsB/YeaQ/YmgE family stress response membrane protein [Pseudogemmobacter hezensis]
MPFISLLIIGAAAGFLATRVMRLQTDVPTTIALGVFGALIGGFSLRFLVWSLGLAAGFVGAFLGALALIVLWKLWMK